MACPFCGTPRSRWIPRSSAQCNGTGTHALARPPNRVSPCDKPGRASAGRTPSSRGLTRHDAGCAGGKTWRRSQLCWRTLLELPVQAIDASDGFGQCVKQFRSVYMGLIWAKAVRSASSWGFDVLGGRRYATRRDTVMQLAAMALSMIYSRKDNYEPPVGYLRLSPRSNPETITCSCPSLLGAKRRRTEKALLELMQVSAFCPALLSNIRDCLQNTQHTLCLDEGPFARRAHVLRSNAENTDALARRSSSIFATSRSAVD